MTNLWHHAVAAVAGRCGGDVRVIERVEPGRDGALMLTARTPAGTRWFAVQAGDCRELLPEEDKALPLAQDLPRLRRTGHVEILAWRPGRRLTLRLQREGAVLVHKGYRPQRFADAVARYALARELFTCSHVRVPDVLQQDVQRACLLLQHMPGAPLAEEAARPENCFRIGMALREAQERPAPTTLAVHGPAQELALLERLAGTVEALTDGWPAGWDDARSRLDARAVPGDARTMAVAHRDLHDGQWLLDDGALVLLDFDLLCRADTALDAANFVAHLKLRALQRVGGAGDEQVLAAGRALLEGLDRDAEPDFVRRLRFHQASSFLRLALLARLRPAWSDVEQPLVHLAHRCVDELQAA